jgi:hypothetical protein
MRFPQFLLDRIIRHKAAIHTIDVNRFQIRLARTAIEYEDAFRLVHVGYVFQGIEPLKPVDLRITEQHVLSEAIVLVAYEGNQLVGTISVTKDSPAGLPLDKDYPEEVGALRAQSARISEIGSLAVVRRCWHTSLMPLLGMAAARVAFRIHKSTHNVIGLHPRAADFYRALWNFHPLGPPRRHSDLDAPVIGLVHEREAARAHMVRYCRRPMRNGLLPVDYSLGERVSEGLYLPEDVPEHEWPRFRMSREVFRELFVERSNRLTELSHRTTNHLRAQRTEQTVGMHSEPISRPVLKSISGGRHGCS